MTAQVGGAIPSSHTALEAQRAALRIQMRRSRRSLPQTLQRKAALSVAQQLLRLPICKAGARIGVYMALPGELSLQPFIESAWARDCQLFVPHITHVGRRKMAFYRFTPGSRLQTEQWGIPQLHNIRCQQRIDTAMLDTVLVPIVAFDQRGNRLGMGAGFYDRHFARLRRTTWWQRPQLIGIAYASQEVGALEVQPHDVQLTMIVTEHTVIHTQRS